MSQHEKLYFYKTDHNRLMGDAAYQGYGPDTVGVLFKLRNMAAQTRQATGLNDGSIKIGSDRKVKFEGLLAHVSAWPGCDRRRARKCLSALTAGGHLSVSKAGYVKLVGWELEQDLAPSSTADRKRHQRDKELLEVMRAAVAVFAGQQCQLDGLKKHLLFATGKKTKSVARGLDLLSASGDMVDVKRGIVRIAKRLSANASAPSPLSLPPSSSDSESDPFECDMSRPAVVTCHVESEIEEREIKSLRVSTTNGGRERGEGEHSTSAASPLERLDVWGEDPVHTALMLTGETSSKLARNTASKKLRELITEAGEVDGLKYFREAMAELKADLVAGRPIVKRGAVLNRKLNERLEAIRGVRTLAESVA